MKDYILEYEKKARKKLSCEIHLIPKRKIFVRMYSDNEKFPWSLNRSPKLKP